MLRAKDEQLMGKITSLEEEKSDLEVAVDKLEKQILQLEEPHPSDIGQLVKVPYSGEFSWNNIFAKSQKWPEL